MEKKPWLNHGWKTIVHLRFLGYGEPCGRTMANHVAEPQFTLRLKCSKPWFNHSSARRLNHSATARLNHGWTAQFNDGSTTRLNHGSTAQFNYVDHVAEPWLNHAVQPWWNHMVRPRGQPRLNPVWNKPLNNVIKPWPKGVETQFRWRLSPGSNDPNLRLQPISLPFLLAGCSQNSPQHT